MSLKNWKSWKIRGDIMQVNREKIAETEFMIKTQRFKQSIEKIREFSRWIDKLYDAGVDIIDSPASSILNEVVELLRILTKDKYDNINWWCYETDFGTNDFVEVAYDDGHVEKIDTVEKLYNFLVEGANYDEAKEF